MDNETYYRMVKPILDRAEKGKYVFQASQYNKSGHCIFNGQATDIDELTAFRLFAFTVQHFPLCSLGIFVEREAVAIKPEYKEVIYWEEDRQWEK